MKRTSECPRHWEAEAIEDGRLEGLDRDSFERHAESCSTCTAEVSTLVQLRQVMQEVPALSSTPFEHRRLRAALLRRADERMVRSRDGFRWHPWRWVPVVAAFGIALLVAVGMYRARRSVSSVAPPLFDIEDRQSAVLTTETTGPMVRVSLSSGSASFHLQRTTERQRFLLSLPDGEIEVHGTRFVVAIADGATRRVDVTEGVVTLRLRDAPAREIRAGDHWDRTASLPSRPSAADTRVGAADDTDEPRPSAAAPQRSPPEHRESPSQDAFSAGVAAFRAGDFRRAEHLLDRFLLSQGKSADPRIEDACFLRAVSRARSGDTEGASRLAKEYLRRFPNGLRRPEAERMAAGQP